MPSPDEPCLEGCFCDADGKRVCEAKTCPSVDCTEYVTLPGECCPSCRNLTEEKQNFTDNNNLPITEAKHVVHSTGKFISFHFHDSILFYHEDMVFTDLKRYIKLFTENKTLC